MGRWFETITDMDAMADVLRRRPYGVIDVVAGEPPRIHLRPYPKIVTTVELLFGGPRFHAHRGGDRCRLFYNQPRQCPNFLALKYVLSARQTNWGTVLRAWRCSMTLPGSKARTPLWARSRTSAFQIGRCVDRAGNRTRRAAGDATSFAAFMANIRRPAAGSIQVRWRPFRAAPRESEKSCSWESEAPAELGTAGTPCLARLRRSVAVSNDCPVGTFSPEQVAPSKRPVRIASDGGGLFRGRTALVAVGMAG